MKNKNLWSSVWRIAKPILTLGLSILCSAIFKANKAGSPIVRDVVNAAGDQILDEIDNSIKNSLNSDKVNSFKNITGSDAVQSEK